jgi:acyl-coenzyme A thioesterase PaaI-like protein
MDRSSEKLTPMAHTAQNRCFGCGPANTAGLRLDFLLAEDGSVVCLPIIPNSFEGPPAFLHGGIIATLLDEVMSKTLRALGLSGLTSQLEIAYHFPVHSGVPIRLEGRLVRSEGRKHWTEAKLLDSRGHVLAEGKGLFVVLRSGHKI